MKNEVRISDHMWQVLLNYKMGVYIDHVLWFRLCLISPVYYMCIVCQSVMPLALNFPVIGFIMSSWLNDADVSSLNWILFSSVVIHMTVFYNLHWATPWFCFVFNMTATIKTPNQIESLVSTFTLFLCVRSNILRSLSNVLNNQQEVLLKLSSFS